MAREEARQRAMKRKYGMPVPIKEGVSKRFKITFRDTHVEETPKPFIVVSAGKEKIMSHAFIDTGSDGNTLSYELYKEISSIVLRSTNTQFEAYTGHTSKAVGYCNLRVEINGLTCGDEFFVTQPLVQDVPIILGRTWQKSYNCYFDWKRNVVHCQSGDEVVITSGIQRLQSIVLNLVRGNVQGICDGHWKILENLSSSVVVTHDKWVVQRPFEADLAQELILGNSGRHTLRRVKHLWQRRGDATDCSAS